MREESEEMEKKLKGSAELIGVERDKGRRKGGD